MNASIITSDRYIAIKSAFGLALNKTVRILTRDDAGREIIVPCKWNTATGSLQSVALNDGPKQPFMYEASNRLKQKLAAAGYSFELLTESRAKELTT